MDFEAIDLEVEQRIQDILDDPSQLQRYDLNKNGVLEEFEIEALSKIVFTEVYRKHVSADAAVAPEEEVETEPEPERLQQTFSPDNATVLADRFAVIRPIGSGGQAHTFLAHDIETDTLVALKELSLGKVNDWKSLDLFEREGEVLKSMSHSNIPSYVDAFVVDGRFFLAQEFVAGKDLEKRLEDGARWDEQRCSKLMHEILDVMTYLHALSPPVIHRDVKPANIIERPDGSFALVDFGAVQQVIPKTIGGSTIAGTAGYMPLEQVMGRSVAATDLYALGATVVHLLSRKHPADLPMVRSKIEFSDYITVSQGFESLLEKLLQTSVEDRPQSALEVKQSLVDMSAFSLTPVGVGSKRLITAMTASTKNLTEAETTIAAEANRVLDSMRESAPFGIQLSPFSGGTVWEFATGLKIIESESGVNFTNSPKYFDFEQTQIVAAILIFISVALMTTTLWVVVAALVAIAGGLAFYMDRFPQVFSLTLSNSSDSLQIKGGFDPSIPLNQIRVFEARLAGDEYAVFVITTNHAKRIANHLDGSQANALAALLNTALIEANRLRRSKRRLRA